MRYDQIEAKLETALELHNISLECTCTVKQKLIEFLIHSCAAKTENSRKNSSNNKRKKKINATNKKKTFSSKNTR